MHVGVLTLIFSCLAGTALGHGYLAEPPGRASAWRYGFDTPVDYNDNECFCGGFNFQYDSMGGKCGICGDPWDQDPRDHEVGGTYATGTIVRDYVQGQVIETIGNVTTNHLGHFEYKICANNDVTIEATQDCLDLTPLYAVGRDDWHLNIGDAKEAVKFDLQLPADLTCTQCVLQWRYVASNTWGTCENGTDALGCGPQEEFRSCADVSISAPKSDVSSENSVEEVVQQEQSLGGESETKSEAIENSEENEDKQSYSQRNFEGQEQKSLKLIEEMAVALNTNKEIQSGSEQENDEVLISETREDDEDTDEEKDEYDSGSESESEEDDD